MIVHYNSAKISQPVSGITRRILANSPGVMLTEHKLEKGAVLPEHSHPHEQLVYLLSGRLIIEMDGAQYDVCEKDSLVIPSSIRHKATAVEPSVALDIFVPSREDYL